SVFRDWLRLYVWSRKRFHWLSLLLPARRSCYLRGNWRSVSRVLVIPVCICRYLLDDYFRRDDRPHEFRRRSALQRGGFRFYLSDHWPLGMGARWISRHDGHCRKLFTFNRNGFSRFRRFDSSSYHRRFYRACRCNRSWTTYWTAVCAWWRWSHAPPRFSYCCNRRIGPLVWLVWIQPWQHFVGHGFRGNRTRCYKHNPGCLCCRVDGNDLRLRSHQKMGPELYRERFPGRISGYYLSLLLGVAHRINHSRCSC